MLLILGIQRQIFEDVLLQTLIRFNDAPVDAFEQQSPYP